MNKTERPDTDAITFLAVESETTAALSAMERPLDMHERDTIQHVIGSPGRLPDAHIERIWRRVAELVIARLGEQSPRPAVITITKTEPDTWSIRGARLAIGCNDLEVEDYEAMAKALGATVVFEDLSEPGPCAHCGKPATCVGSYESNDAPVARACDDCCGHGNEDGWCNRYGGGDDE